MLIFNQDDRFQVILQIYNIVRRAIGVAVHVCFFYERTRILSRDAFVFQSNTFGKEGYQRRRISGNKTKNTDKHEKHKSSGAEMHGGRKTVKSKKFENGMFSRGAA